MGVRNIVPVTRRSYNEPSCLALVIVVLTALFAGAAHAQKGTAPKTPPKTKRQVVKEMRLDPAPTPSVVGVTVERYVHNIDVRADGSAVQTVDIVQRYRSKTAISALSLTAVEFNRDMDEVEFSDAYILKKNGRKVAVPASALQIKRTPQAEAAPSFSSMMVASVEFPGLEVGDAGHYLMTVRSKRSHFDGHFDSFHYLQAVYDWDSAEINLRAPADYPLYIEAIDLDGGRLPDDGGTARWQWKKTGFKAIELEPLMFDIIAASPRLSITSFKDFDTLGKAYWEHAAERTAVTPEIRALADEITKGITAPEQQAYAIYEWVNKNIRYLSLVMDRSGWVPHSASEILANRYGDCKDYATVLDALLEAKGIESHTVLIRSDLGTWFPSVAIPAYFNHAVLYIPSLGLFADATAANTRLGLVPQTIVGKKALLAGTRTGLIETSRDQPDDNQLASDVILSISPVGDVRSTSTTTFKGRAEMLFRPMFADAARDSETFVRIMLAFYGMEGTGRITKVTNPFRLGEAFQVTTDVVLPSHSTLTASGAFQIPAGINLINSLALADLLEAETRKTELPLGAMRMSEKYSVRFPEGVAADVPPDAEFTNAFGRFASRFRKDGENIDVTRELVLTRDVVAPSEYPQVRELIKKAATAFQTAIPYRASLEITKGSAAGAANKRPAPQLGKIFDEIYKHPYERIRALTASDIRKLEAKIAADPADVETRRTLTSYYWNAEGKATPEKLKGRFVHRLWLVQNHPEISDAELMISQFSGFAADSPEYAALKSAWLKQVEAAPKNSEIRLNAFAALGKNEREVAANLLMDGLRLDPDDYRFPLEAAKMYASEEYGVTVDAHAGRKARLTEQLKHGRTALGLLKKERSDERDRERFFLLKSLAGAAYEVGEENEAGRLATELILDFGQDASAYGYDNASHVGNIILGRIALRNKDVAKAKEHLLIAIRAPLRRPTSWLSDIDTRLAKELFEHGEKATVVEYLKLCEGLSNLTTEKELFKDQARALRLWQAQILAGKTPSFDFYKL